MKNCPKCGRESFRERLQKEWDRGEKVKKGYWPNLYRYLICDACGYKGMEIR